MIETDALLTRHLIPELRDALLSARVVNLIGPRQAGKTTLVRDLFNHGKFITLDDIATFEAINADPIGHVQTLTADLDGAPLIIDEAQRSPALSFAVKRLVDENRRKGQFVLTGSSNVFNTATVADSLAGRMRTLKLWPFTAAEWAQQPVSNLIDWALQYTPKLTQVTANLTPRTKYIDLILRG